ncbi:MAG TPA: SDR family oxidoreductase [Thermoanaerobaculia bacterium]|nr:SDR family oxidoreductase [Thermoanaerobaculia bacterium]
MPTKKARDPKQGKKPSKSTPSQSTPGRERGLRPQADHGEESYRGCGKLEGLVAIITGGDSGIGRAVAIAFAREGADVAIGYLSEKEDEDARETQKWVEGAGRRCIVARFDVKQRNACKRFVERVVKELGRLDILVNNAAYQQEQQSILDITEEQLQGTFRTNIFGYIYMVQAALPHLKSGAVILNTGSVTAMRGSKTLLDYSATKGAIHTFTRALADNLAEQGIRVNCVAPGPVWTPLIPATMDRKHVKKFGENTVWGRPAQPAEIAPSYVFLASADAKYYTGEVLAPTGSETTR